MCLTNKKPETCCENIHYLLFWTRQARTKTEFVIFDKLVRNFSELWEGKESSKSSEQEKFGLRDLRTTKEKMLNATLNALETENLEFLTYVFQSLLIHDRSVMFSTKNGIHHSKNKGKTLIQIIAEKAYLIFIYQ